MSQLNIIIAKIDIYQVSNSLLIGTATAIDTHATIAKKKRKKWLKHLLIG